MNSVRSRGFFAFTFLLFSCAVMCVAMMPSEPSGTLHDQATLEDDGDKSTFAQLMSEPVLVWNLDELCQARGSDRHMRLLYVGAGRALAPILFLLI